jgi:hypothetical protein
VLGHPTEIVNAGDTAETEYPVDQYDIHVAGIISTQRRIGARRILLKLTVRSCRCR